MYIKRLQKNKILFFGIVLSLGLFFSTGFVDAATIKINSNSSTFSVGDTATMSVVVNSENFSINNAEAVIKFPADLVDVISVSKSGSIFSLWVEDPVFSNSAGTITFNGGLPTPGFNGGQGLVVSFVVRAKKVGQGEFVFSNAAVRANDGLGTDVLNNKQGRTISVIAKVTPVVEETPILPQPQSPVTALQITSPTHQSQELWYKDNSPVFKWKIPTGVDAVQTGIDNNISSLPRVTFSPAISERKIDSSIKALEDGIWYFKVRARKDGNWGPVSTYIARIDSVVPIKNNVSFSYDDNKKVLDINADIVDETSGLDYYEIYINDLLVKKVLATDFQNGNYNLTVDVPGTNNVKLVAVDRAGNSVEALGTFQATAKEEIQQTQLINNKLLVSIGSFSAPIVYVVLVMLSISAILSLGAFKLGRHYNKVLNRFKVRTSLAKGDNTKLLLSLKKRLEKHLDILQNTRHSRVLSKEEKEIKEAIESDLDEVDKAIEKQKLLNQ